MNLYHSSQVKLLAMRATLIACLQPLLLGWCFGANPTLSDANWVGFNGQPGADATVTATAVDGRGNLYVGGVFQTIGNTTAHCIAKWDGREWSTLGRGMDNAVQAFAFGADGSVYASGAFIWATSNDGTVVTAVGVAKWDGKQWSDLDRGVSEGLFGGYFFVHALAIWGTDLYAGGFFLGMGGVPAHY